jgi:hypothetical protein
MEIDNIVFALKKPEISFHVIDDLARPPGYE